VLVDLAKDRARLEQLLLGAARRDAAVLEHDDLVRERDRREAVRDDERRPVAHRLPQPLADQRLRRGVDRRGRVVEDEDAGIYQERACNREPLALPAGERDAALADDGVVALRQVLDEPVRLRGAGGALDLGLRRPDEAEGDVVAHGGGEEERILGDDADLAPERAACDVAHVDAVDEDAPRRDVVEARHERGERRLPRARVPDEGDRAAGGNVEVDVLEHCAVCIRKRDVLEGDAAHAAWEVASVCEIGDLLGLVEHFEDPLAGRRRPLRLPDPHAEHAERHHEHREQQVEGEEVAERERAVHDHPAGDE
jgi:hypothetical protein